MLWQFGEVVEIEPGENSLTVWGGARQRARVSTDRDDDGLGFDALFFAVGVSGDHVVVSVEATRTLNDAHAL